ncbi:MAG: hypothetical protein KAR13_10470, partial [Desulfobulbaceae bacterium]|nr:hypothetical protein [Desulfobulbaceae bacterium]
MCHNPEQDGHYGAENCSSCHDPHSPQIANRKTGKPLKPLCTACHPQQNKQMQDYPSRHGSVDCIICHTKHREFFTCQKCHEPHEEGTSYEQCLVCHNPHMPTHIKFTDPTAESICKNCHTSEQTLIDTKGAGHKTDVSCIDCHEQHGKAGIPECDVCHGPDDSIHYKVGNCASCHDPHDPLTVKVSAVEEAKPACISCHPEQGGEMQTHPSAHAQEDCTLCHEQHKTFLNCLECHDAHTESMTYANCLQCHAPHSPMLIKYDSSAVVSDFCSSCHEETTRQIDEQGVGHKTEISCTDCHEQHGKAGIPECATC